MNINLNKILLSDQNYYFLNESFEHFTKNVWNKCSFMFIQRSSKDHYICILNPFILKHQTIPKVNLNNIRLHSYIKPRTLAYPKANPILNVTNEKKN